MIEATILEVILVALSVIGVYVVAYTLGHKDGSDGRKWDPVLALFRLLARAVLRREIDGAPRDGEAGEG